MDSPQRIGELELIKSNRIIHPASLFAKRFLALVSRMFFMRKLLHEFVPSLPFGDAER